MSETISQRIDTLKGFLAQNRITLKEVAIEAGFNYKSVWNQMRLYNMSEERIEKLEATALLLRENKEASRNRKSNLQKINSI